MISKLLKIFLSLALIILVLGPGLALAAEPSGLVPACRDAATGCHFNDLYQLAGNVINFLIFALAVPLAAIAITYAGIIMVLNPANEGKRKEAKDIIYLAALGLIIALASYLIVDTILRQLTDKTVDTLFPTNTTGP